MKEQTEVNIGIFAYLIWFFGFPMYLSEYTDSWIILFISSILGMFIMIFFAWLIIPDKKDKKWSVSIIDKKDISNNKPRKELKDTKIEIEKFVKEEENKKDNNVIILKINNKNDTYKKEKKKKNISNNKFKKELENKKIEIENFVKEQENYWDFDIEWRNNLQEELNAIENKFNQEGKYSLKEKINYNIEIGETKYTPEYITNNHLNPEPLNGIWDKWLTLDIYTVSSIKNENWTWDNEYSKLWRYIHNIKYNYDKTGIDILSKVIK